MKRLALLTALLLALPIAAAHHGADLCRDADYRDVTADIIFEGTVDDINGVGDETFIRFDVEEEIKGNLGRSVRLVQPGDIEEGEWRPGALFWREGVSWRIAAFEDRHNDYRIVCGRHGRTAPSSEQRSPEKPARADGCGVTLLPRGPVLVCPQDAEKPRFTPVRTTPQKNAPEKPAPPERAPRSGDWVRSMLY